MLKNMYWVLKNAIQTFKWSWFFTIFTFFVYLYFFHHWSILHLVTVWWMNCCNCMQCHFINFVAMYRQGTDYSYNASWIISLYSSYFFFFRFILTFLNTDINQFLKVLFMFRDHSYILFLTYFQFMKDLLYRVSV